MFNTILAPLNRRLLLLVAVALLPAMVLGVVGVIMLVQQQYAMTELASIHRVRAVMSAIDKELQSDIAATQVLVSSRHLDKSNLSAFRAELRSVLAGRPTWDALALLDGEGRRLFTVHRDHDEAAGPVRDRATYARLLKTREPVVGRVRKRSDGRLVFSVGVPRISAGRVQYVLAPVIDTATLMGLLERQQIPPESIMTIFDGELRIVARTRQYGEYGGSLVAPSLVQLMGTAREGFGISTTLDNRRVYTAFARSRISEWGVALGYPLEGVDVPVKRSYLVLGTGLLLSIALGAAAAILIARRISGPISDLGTMAEAVGRGQLPQMPATEVPEVRRVAELLRDTAQARQRADAAREDLLRREREARSAAENDSRRKDGFLAMLGHELRNPVAAIGNAAQILAVIAEGGPEHRRVQQILTRQVDHLSRLLDDLLDVARVNQGKIAIHRGLLDLSVAIGHALAAFRESGQAGHHRLRIDLSSCWVSADSHRIEQIVINLLTNAVKYAPADTEVAVELRTEGKEAVLRVSDQGPGIDPELMPRIFDLFVQGQQALDRAPGGLGIGLTLVRALVELHGGNITAHSGGTGRGSVFTVRLPLAAAPGPMTEEQAPSSPPRMCRVLIVEDSEDVRETMRLLLEMDGHRVDQAQDGSAGLALLTRNEYDIAFVDIGLPGLDGYELARRARAQGLGLRLVALSGYGQPEDRERALAAGFDRHLTKPVGGASLARLLAWAATDRPASSAP